jgi:hypothetical protein
MICITGQPEKIDSWKVSNRPDIFNFPQMKEADWYTGEL